MHAERVTGTLANGDLNRKQFLYFMPHEGLEQDIHTSMVVKDTCKDQAPAGFGLLSPAMTAALPEPPAETPCSNSDLPFTPHWPEPPHMQLLAERQLSF